MELALGVLARQKAHIPFTEWTWGGGSALSYRYRHRDSEDVDIFFRDAQALPFFSPRVNGDLERVAIRYSEMSHFIKVWIKEDAQIDFILAPLLTEEPFTVEHVMGRMIQVETPWEIATKKLHYRSCDLKVRDVVDVVAVLRHREDRERLLQNSEVFAGNIAEISKRLDYLEKAWREGVKTLSIFDESLKHASIVEELRSFLLDVAGRKRGVSEGSGISVSKP